MTGAVMAAVTGAMAATVTGAMTAAVTEARTAAVTWCDDGSGDRCDGGLFVPVEVGKSGLPKILSPRPERTRYSHSSVEVADFPLVS